MGGVVDDIQARNLLAMEQEHGRGLLLAEDRHQNIDPTHFFSAPIQDIKYRTLQCALEALRRLCIALLGKARRIGFHELLQLCTKMGSVPPQAYNLHPFVRPTGFSYHEVRTALASASTRRRKYAARSKQKQERDGS